MPEIVADPVQEAVNLFGWHGETLFSEQRDHGAAQKTYVDLQHKVLERLVQLRVKLFQAEVVEVDDDDKAMAAKGL